MVARLPLAERLAARLVPGPGDCLLWTGAKASHGYGHIGHEGRLLLVHRVAYEVAKGPIPAGLHIDHLCRVRHCCNPDHLEAVTQRENNLRGISPAARNAKKTHCKWGHEFTPENTFTNVGRTGRQCRTCHLRRSTASQVDTRAKKRAVRAARATLRAAAPDLLEAAKTAERALSMAVRAAISQGDFSAEEVAEIDREHVGLRQLRAAIALATREPT